MNRMESRHPGCLYGRKPNGQIVRITPKRLSKKARRIAALKPK